MNFNTNQTSGFGTSQTTASPFSASSTQPPAFGAPSFGTNSANQPPQTSLFGASQPASTSANSFSFGGNANSASEPFGSGGKPASLFGNNPATNNPTPSFNQNSQNLFNQNNQNSVNQNNQNLANQNNQNLANQNNQNLFNQNSQNPGNALMATLDQASFTLPGVAPSEKLYTSLSAPPLKRSASHEREISRERLHHRLTAPSRPTFRAGMPQKLPASLSNGENLVAPRSAGGAAPVARAEPRKWINSYDAFLRARPTTLVVDRAAQLRSPFRMPHCRQKLAVPCVSSAPPPVPNASQPASAPTDKDRLDQDQSSELEKAGDVSLFHKRANNMTLVQVNPQALTDGYFVRPRLEELASLTKTELQAVHGLTIGRRNFGQIEYGTVVDLSTLKNLGDMLGKLVLFATGSVCVYPETGRQCPPGRELNLPAIVSLENVFPKDARTRQIITNPEDKRVQKFVRKLRESCEQRGGEFITYQRGTWVFKVPHFSTWGLAADDMVVDDDDDVFIGDNDDNVEIGDEIGDGIGELSDAETPKPLPEIVSPNQSSEEVLPHFASSPILSALDPSASDELVDEDLSSSQLDEPLPGSVNLPQSWLEQLGTAVTGVLEAKAASLAAASQPTPQLDLAEMLLPNADRLAPATTSEPTNETTALIAKFGAEFPSNQGTDLATSAAVFSQLKSRIHVTSRSGANTNLPLLSCGLDFSRLNQVYPTMQSLWQLLAILYECEPAKTLTKLKAYFDQSVQATPVELSSDALTACWQLFSRHDIVGAFAHASRTQNPHLALLMAMLTSTSTAKEIQTSAKAQIEAWQNVGFKSSIPAPLLRIWEVVAGTPPSALDLNWRQWLGIHYWYLSPAQVSMPVQNLPPSLLTTTSPCAELAFLQFYSQLAPLKSALTPLNLGEAFLCTLALKHADSTTLSSDQDLVDAICAQLAKQLLSENQFVFAVMVALHIADSDLALSSVREILCDMPPQLDLPPEFGVPVTLVHECRATQAARRGKYTLQCEHLLAAHQFEAAHAVLLAEVAPRAVLSEQLAACLPLLESLEPHAASIERWDAGGGVYLRFARIAGNPALADPYAVMALCNACRYIATPTLPSQQAVSRIAEWVAGTAYAQRNIKPEMILGMKFAPSQARIAVMEQAAHLLF